MKIPFAALTKTARLATVFSLNLQVAATSSSPSVDASHFTALNSDSSRTAWK